MTGANQPAAPAVPRPIEFCHPEDAWEQTAGAPPGPHWYFKPASPTAGGAQPNPHEVLRLRQAFVAAMHQWLMLSRCRPMLNRRRKHFAKDWGFAASTVSRVFNGQAPLSHEMLAALRAIIDDEVFAPNKDVRRYLDGVLSSVDETLALLRPNQRARGQRTPQQSQRQQRMMNALTNVTVTLDPDSLETQERLRRVERAVLPSLFAAAKTNQVPTGLNADYAADVSVSVADTVFASGDVVDGELIGHVGVRTDWLDRIATAGWSNIGGHSVLDVTSWDPEGRPVGIRTVRFDTLDPLPYFGADDLTEDDEPEVIFGLTTATVTWTTSEAPTVTIT